tara:strand:+ start:6455 stop:6868 length:414 start_codon:yes stop_codon:yes gene_type:complete
MSVVCKININLVRANANRSHINGVGLGIAILTQGIQELNYAIAKEKELVDCDNQVKKVDLLIQTIDGKEIGAIQTEEGIEFVTKDLECAITQDAIKKIKQRYSKYLVLHELKHKGYEKIKEERLPNGAIRMVVEKWE